MLNLYVCILILGFYIPLLFKGLFASSGELIQKNRTLSSGKRIFWTILTVLILVALKRCWFGGNGTSTLSFWLSIIIGFEIISGVIKLFFDYDEILYNISPLLPKIPIAVELLYFCVLVLSIFGLTPGLSASHSTSPTEVVQAPEITKWDPEDYQKEPQKYVDVAKQKLPEQSTAMEQIASELESLGTTFKASTDQSLAINAVTADLTASAARIIENKLQVAQQEINANSNLSTEQMSATFGLIQQADIKIPEYRTKIEEFKRQISR